MVIEIAPHLLPAANENALYLDYISGKNRADHFFSFSFFNYDSALKARQGYAYPRKEAAASLVTYNTTLGAHRVALENAHALAASDTFCVVTGQQAGFLGGPAYTLYKIITAIRLAEHLQATLPGRFVPVFWLASEDHDFAEINHAYFMRRDGEVGKVDFSWSGEGQPVANLPLDQSIRQAYETYFQQLVPGPYWEQAKALTAPGNEVKYCTWQARMWSRLFSDRGLVIVEPYLLRPWAKDLLRAMLDRRVEIEERLSEAAQALTKSGYSPALDPAQSGGLFTFDRQGARVRVADAASHMDRVLAHPEQYSTDAALRPLLADATLPVVCSVLGPGEVAYQAMLKPLYELFEVPQPCLLPRKSYTVIGSSEAETMNRYQTSAKDILSDHFEIDETFQNLVPEDERHLFVEAREGIESSLAPLAPFLQGIDPSLERTWSQTVYHSLRNVDKLEDRAFKARMSQLGFSKHELQTLRNVLLPRGRLQERVLPLPYFINRFGEPFLDRLFETGALDDFAHHILIIEENNV